MLETKINNLIHAAFNVRKYAYAPYSGISVGAALACENDVLFMGCNIENAAFSSTICAERVAIAQAIAAGYQSFIALAVCGGPIRKDSGNLENFYPCGECLQVLAEFCSNDFPIFVAISENNYQRFFLDELLPYPFSSKNLK